MDFREIAQRLVRERPGIAWDELVESVAGAAGIDAGDIEATAPIERLVEAHMDDERWEILAGDRLIDPVALVASVVLTHRLSGHEVDSGVLDLQGDLSPFRYQREGLHTPVGDTVTRVTELPVQGWWGPEGWLAAFEPGALVGVRVVDQVVTVEGVDEPAVDAALVERLRSIYEAELAEPGLPVDLSDLLFGAVVDDAAWFAQPQPPLCELGAAAGLEVRGSRAAHGDEVWENEVHHWRIRRVLDLVDGREAQIAVLEVMEVLDGRGENVDDLAARVRALPPLALSALASVFFDGGPLATARPLDEVAERIDDLLAATDWRPRDEVKLRWLAAVTDERRGRPLDALAHLEAGVRLDPSAGPVVDRLAWYRSDAGDADGARKLWGSIAGAGAFHPDLAVLSALPRAGDGPAGGPRPGRNEPCWCGSGRKFKVCHLGRDEALPLPDRVLWLNRKTMAYLERRGGLDDDLFTLAECRAGVDIDDDPEAVEDAMDDPLVADVALVELGWFDVFLEERGPLLPADEALLAASWALVERTVYEVVEVDPGASMTVRDLRTGDVIEVRERTLSRHAGVRTLLCGRAVPDGAGHQFIGAIFAVPPGREGRLLEILDEADGYELLEYVCALERPPALQTQESEPLVECRAELVVDDARSAELVLDEYYERDEGEATWREYAPVGGDGGDGDGGAGIGPGRILRAALDLDGDRLTVETMSEARLDRVLAVLAAELPGARVVADERQPVDAATMAERTVGFRERADGEGVAGPFADPSSPEYRDALAQIIEQYERRWCDEPVPALGGLTPRAAVADPTRREEVERLLASFPEPAADDPDAALTMRPSRLRELLGLPPA